jgi:hypothetical protein
MPSSPHEDIVLLYMSRSMEIGRVRGIEANIVFASRTASENLAVLPTLLMGSPPTEKPALAWDFIPITYGPSATYYYGWIIVDERDLYVEDGHAFIAIYAWLPGAKTDRAPDTGMYRIKLAPEWQEFTDPAETSPPPPPLRPPSYPVGGTFMYVNKLAILSPYLALIGLAAVVTVAVIKRKR